MPSFNTISHDVWPDHQTDIWSINVSQVKLRKTSYLYIFPCCSGNHASIPEKAPERLKHILQKVCPGWRIWDNMFQKVESATLKHSQQKRLHCVHVWLCNAGYTYTGADFLADTGSN